MAFMVFQILCPIILESICLSSMETMKVQPVIIFNCSVIWLVILKLLMKMCIWSCLFKLWKVMLETGFIFYQQVLFHLRVSYIQPSWSNLAKGWYSKFLRIHIENGELVHQFNIRFGRTLNEIPKKCSPDDQVNLIVYLDAFNKNVSYQLRDKEPRTLYQVFMIAIEIKNKVSMD